MKLESDPVTEDEWLIRLVWEDRVTDRVPIISPNSFEPKKHENDGISLFRRSCLTHPTQALLVLVEEKRPRNAIVQIPVSLMKQLGLEVKASPIDVVPGHVVIPQLNFNDYRADRAKFTPLKLRLAQEASKNILQMPNQSSSE